MPTIQIDRSMNVYYEIDGQGTPLILLHGLTINSQSWKKQIEGLKDQFTVIAWDAPGYGQSSDPKQELQHFSDFAMYLKKFVDALDLGPVYLLGHSMGSGIATEFCVQYPEAVKGLILANPTRGGSVLDPEVNRRDLEKRLQLIETLTPQDMAKQRVRTLFAPNPSEELVKETEELIAQVRPMGYRSAVQSISSAEVDSKYELIEVATLIICGTMDNVTPVSESKAVHAKVPNAKLELIEDTAHMCHLEKPAVFNDIVRNFLNHLK